MNVKPEDVWAAIDHIADARQESLGKLALYAGLDQSTFTYSRRRRNLLSMATLLRLLNAYDIDFKDFGVLVDETAKQRKRT